jgi:hypothetical protein
VATLNLILSVITLNVNHPNALIKRKRISAWMKKKKQDTIRLLPARNQLCTAGGTGSQCSHHRKQCGESSKNLKIELPYALRFHFWA